MPPSNLGTLNKKWGVCGFTSSFYAMYDHSPGVRGQLINATRAYRVLAEIKTYLRTLQASGSPLLADITSFTRSFGPAYANFTIGNYINNIDALDRPDEIEMGQAEATLSTTTDLFDIAMPPAAVVDYLSRMWGVNTQVGDRQITKPRGIIGVRDVKNGIVRFFQNPKYKGLCHYMYYDNGSIYSWGQVFGSVTEAANSQGATWEICYFIPTMT